MNKFEKKFLLLKSMKPPIPLITENKGIIKLSINIKIDIMKSKILFLLQEKKLFRINFSLIIVTKED